MSVPIHPDRSEIAESDAPGHRRPGGARVPPEIGSTEPSEDIRDEAPRRILFLDDDPRRAEVFLGRNPEAIWIQTAQDCITRLTEVWDEVYLDHDLGGEHFVDVERPDCGMEVVRWLCKEPIAHLMATRFVIHSHNLAAALMMVLLMRETGYKAEFFPFGFSLEMDPFSPTAPKHQSAGTEHQSVKVSGYRRWFGRLARIFGRAKGASPGGS